MKRLEKFVTRNIADETVMVPIGKTAQKFSGMIMANSTAEFIWNHIEEVDSVEELTNLICDEYDVSYEEALEDTTNLVQNMKDAGWIV